MTDRDRIVIVGGGHNGLVCAAYLASAGREVVVLEAAAAGRRRRGHARVRQGLQGLRLRAPARTCSMPGIARELKLASHGLKLVASGPQDRRARPAAASTSCSTDGKLESGTVSDADRKGLADYHARMLTLRADLRASSTTASPRALGGGDRSRPDGRGAARPRHPPPRPRRHARVPAHRRHQHLRRARGDLRVGAAEGRARPRRRARHEPRAALEQLRARAAAPPERTGRGQRRALASRRAAWARSARRWRRRRARPARRSARRARSSASRSRATASPASSSRAARRSPPARSSRTPIPQATLLGLLGARHLETGFVAARAAHPHARAWPRSCTSRSTPCPPSRGCRAELAGERLVIAPDLVYLEHAFDAAKYGQCSPEPALEISDPDRARQDARARRQARAVGRRAVRAVRRARERRRRAARAPRAHARRPRAPRAGPAPADRRVRAAAAGGHRARVPHHGRPLASRRARARPVPDAAAGARAPRSTRCRSAGSTCAARAAIRAAASWAPPAAMRRTRCSPRSAQHEHQGRDGPRRSTSARPSGRRRSTRGSPRSTR